MMMVTAALESNGEHTVHLNVDVAHRMESGTRCELRLRPQFAPVDQPLPLARELEMSNN